MPGVKDVFLFRIPKDPICPDLPFTEAAREGGLGEVSSQNNVQRNVVEDLNIGGYTLCQNGTS